MGRLTAGGNTGVSVTNTGALVAADNANFAVLFWFRVPDNAAGSDFAQLWGEVTTGPEDRVTLQIKQSGALSFFYRPGGFGQPSASITTPTTGYDDNLWHWAFAVRRASNDYQLYVDGTSGGTSTTDVTNTMTKLSVDLFRLFGGNTLPANSQLAHYMAWKQSLTIDQARSAAYGRPTVQPNIWLPLLSLPGDEPDWSGNGYNGTVTSLSVGDTPPIRGLGQRRLLDYASYVVAASTTFTPSFGAMAFAGYGMSLGFAINLPDEL